MLNLAQLALLPLALAAPSLDARGIANVNNVASETIPGKYVVVLKQDATERLQGRSIPQAFASFKPNKSFGIGKFQGFSAELSGAQINDLKMDTRVSVSDSSKNTSLSFHDPFPPHIYIGQLTPPLDCLH